jgi:hypothetical protein
VRDPISTSEYPPAYFPGIVVGVLAAVAIVTVSRPGVDRASRGRVLGLTALAATAVVLSLGTQTPVYGWLYSAFPPLAAIRAVARFGVLWMLATGVLAGLGLAVLRKRVSPRAGVILAAAAIVLVNVEALRSGFAGSRVYTKSWRRIPLPSCSSKCRSTRPRQCS